jgi:hypothetical protein
MPQAFPTSAQVVFDTLVADSTFMSLLGQYKFEHAASPATAISIVSPGADLPALRNVSGLECVIQDVGSITTNEYISGDADFSTIWNVFIVAFSPATGANVHAAVTRVCQLFVGAASVQTVSVTDGLGALVQTKIEIRSDRPIRA